MKVLVKNQGPARFKQARKSKNSYYNIINNLVIKKNNEYVLRNFEKFLYKFIKYICKL